jgi:hypothetical protein
MRDPRDTRRQQLRAELIARLERVRGRMTDAEFEKLIAAVERTAARFAEIDAGPLLSASMSRDRRV